MELDHLFAVDGGQIIEYEEHAGALELVRFWLNTPKGERWGNPVWGHELIRYKHDPQGTSTEIGIEAMIFKKLPTDLPSIEVRGVRVIFTSECEALLSVMTQYGLVQDTYNFKRAV